MAQQFKVAATGGTFDEIHAGHIALLSKAFEVADHVIIGVSSDKFAAKRGKKLNHDYDTRVSNLKRLIAQKFGTPDYTIARLEGEFGPAVTTGHVDVLVASSETAVRGEELNATRKTRGLKPVAVISVDLVLAEDGNPISSTRIRRGEIDAQGKILKYSERPS
ncbi:MAG: pantetheine-phosphate adenylyltransferase [Nitrososphaera sp.]|jgi:pantetheine-phosphate adenylyltransferase